MALILAVSVPVAGVALWLILRGLRGNMDLVALHARETVRHLIAGFLLLGTLAGTVWTFSNGQLTLNAWLERVVSVGGIAAALEVGSIFTGLYIQQLDLRIKTTKRKEQQDEYRKQRNGLYWWFGGLLVISGAANFTFRYQQLGNGWSATLATVAPILLIIVFTIVLRPLHPDYQEMGRQATQRGLVQLTRSSQQVFMRHLRDMGRGKELGESEMRQLTLAASLLRMYAATSEQQALDFAITQGAGTSTVEASAEEYLTSADVSRLWQVPQRTAQLWVSQAQGRRKASKGNAWLAPVSAIVAQHGYAHLEIEPPRRRRVSKPRANSEQTPATDQQEGAEIPAEVQKIAAIEQ